MTKSIKTPAYFEAGFQHLDETLAIVGQTLADALPLEQSLQNLVPWRLKPPSTAAIPEGNEAAAAQVLSISFELLNLVEDRVAWQFRTRRRAEHGPAAIKGLWPDTIQTLQANGLDEDGALEVLRKLKVEPVLTAHPTEAKRPTVRQKHLNIYEILRQYETAQSDPHFGRRVKDSLSAELEALWFTGEIFVQRPNINDELQNALSYLRDIFPAVILRLDRSLELAWEDAGWNPRRLIEEDALPNLQFATWIGGDRDGHPGVTPEITSHALDQLRNTAFRLHRRHLYRNAKALTFAQPFARVPAALSEAVNSLTKSLGDTGLKLRSLHQREPWRHYLLLLREKLSLSPKDGGYDNPEAYRADLLLARDTMLEAGAVKGVHEWIQPLLRLADTFGFHLARLDIRNNSEAHDEAAAELFTHAGIPDAEHFATWPEEKRRDLLLAELRSPRPLLSRYDLAGEKAQNILSYLRLVATHHHQHGPAGLGQLIISMTRSVSDLLLMQVLAKEAGLATMQPNGLWRSHLPVSPLFETGHDLAQSAQIITEYLDCVGKHPGGLQPAMVGYSDSNKDAGVFASQWGIYRAQEAMTAACNKAGVTPQFFHGRGGTIGRGAGPTGWFLRALPQNSLAGPVRITEQGEVLPRKYGHEGNAHYNLETLIAGVARTVASKPKPSATPNPASLDLLATESTKAYRNLLDDPGFITFYRAATPIDALESGLFGSRPSRRTGKKEHSLADLRAIPWVFSWTQARFYLPGWYGLGSGLEALAKLDPDTYADLEQNIDGLPLLRYVFANVETSLASANLELMECYADLCDDTTIRDRIMTRIREEYTRTREQLGHFLGGDFATRRPRMCKTLALREQPLRLLHHQQIKLLQSWRNAGSPLEAPDARFDRTFLSLQLTINAISTGLRETG